MLYYTQSSHIESIDDVQLFFDHLIYDRKVNFHPDDSFDQYVNVSTNEPTFSPNEVKIYDRLMDESFEVCESENIDIYAIGYEKLISWINQDINKA